MNKFIDKKHSRTEHQKQVMDEIEKDGVCPFCIENLSEYHKNPILYEGDFWLFTENQWPYEGVKKQFLAISKTHIEHITELPEGASEELFKYFKILAEKSNMVGGGVAIRFGAPNEYGSYGSSVTHLHAHLLEPDLQNMKEEKFKFKFGQKNK